MGIYKSALVRIPIREYRLLQTAKRRMNSHFLLCKKTKINKNSLYAPHHQSHNRLIEIKKQVDFL